MEHDLYITERKTDNPGGMHVLACRYYYGYETIEILVSHTTAVPFYLVSPFVMTVTLKRRSRSGKGRVQFTVFRQSYHTRAGESVRRSVVDLKETEKTRCRENRFKTFYNYTHAERIPLWVREAFFFF